MVVEDFLGWWNYECLNLCVCDRERERERRKRRRRREMGGDGSSVFGGFFYLPVVTSIAFITLLWFPYT